MILTLGERGVEPADGPADTIGPDDAVEASGAARRTNRADRPGTTRRQATRDGPAAASGASDPGEELERFVGESEEPHGDAGEEGESTANADERSAGWPCPWSVDADRSPSSRADCPATAPE